MKKKGILIGGRYHWRCSFLVRLLLCLEEAEISHSVEGIQLCPITEVQSIPLALACGASGGGRSFIVLFLMLGSILLGYPFATPLTRLGNFCLHPCTFQGANCFSFKSMIQKGVREPRKFTIQSVLGCQGSWPVKSLAGKSFALYFQRFFFFFFSACFTHNVKFYLGGGMDKSIFTLYFWILS